MANACTKALKALNAIKLIKKYLNKTEILQLITSNVYSVLYYNSEIWHLPNLKSSLKQKLLNVSARALKISMFYPDPMISFLKIHEITKRAPPESMMKYKLAVQLYKIYNSHEHSLEWVQLNYNQILTSRQTKFSISKESSKKVGQNMLTDRLSSLNGMIPFEWLNNSIETYKVKCKNLLL